MIKSRIGPGFRTTIPRAVRDTLGVRAGDELTYLVRGGTCLLTRADTPPVDDPFALFTEWGSEEDRKGYENL